MQDDGTDTRQAKSTDAPCAMQRDAWIPELSVVICSYNGAARLQPTLAALSRCEVAFNVEVILVDNNSSDGTAEIGQRIWSSLEAPRFRFGVIHETRPGLSSARQAGIRAARGTIIVFCDDDNWLDRDYLKLAMHVLDAHPEVGAAGGRAQPDYDQPPPAWFERHADSFALGVQAPQEGDVSETRGWLWGAGLIVRTSALVELERSGIEPVTSDRAGEKMTTGGDVEMCLYLRELGWRLWYSPALMLVHHVPRARFNRRKFSELTRQNGILYATVIYPMHLERNRLWATLSTVKAFVLKELGARQSLEWKAHYFLGKLIGFATKGAAFAAVTRNRRTLATIRERKTGFRLLHAPTLGDGSGALGTASRQTIVFITEVLPAPVSDGATRRTAALLDVIGSAYEVVCVFIGDESLVGLAKQKYPAIEWICIPPPERWGAKSLGPIGVWGQKATFLLDHYILGDGSRHEPNAKLGVVLNALRARRDVLAAFARYMPAACATGQTDIPLVIDVDDDFEEWLGSATSRRRYKFMDLLAAWRNRVMAARYRRKLVTARVALFSRRDDAAKWSRVVPTVFAPNVFEMRPGASSSESPGSDRLRIGLLAGALTRSNLSGAQWLVQNVVTPILSDLSLRDRVQFVFAGRVSVWIAKTYPELAADPAVEFLGVIDRVESFYEKIDIATSPVFFGGGTSVKFNEALSWGTPVLSSVFGARGYEGPAHSAVMISDSPAEWIAAVRELAINLDQRQLMKAKAQDLRTKMATGRDEFKTNVLGALVQLRERQCSDLHMPTRAAAE